MAFPKLQRSVLASRENIQLLKIWKCLFLFWGWIQIRIHSVTTHFYIIISDFPWVNYVHKRLCNLHDIEGEIRTNIFQSIFLICIQPLWPCNMIEYSACILNNVGKVCIVCTYFFSFIIKKQFYQMFWQVLLHEHVQNVCWIPAWSIQSKAKIRKGTRVFSSRLVWGPSPSPVSWRSDISFPLS